jgi:hypothetical protein
MGLYRQPLFLLPTLVADAPLAVIIKFVAAAGANLKEAIITELV